MHFGEYELSPSLIGLSPLPQAHPEAFQRLSVRTSIRRYPDFILAWGRSHGFASSASDWTPSSDSPSLRLRGSCRLTSPDTETRRFIMQKARRHPAKGLRPLVGVRFQGLFHSSARSSFHLSLTVLVRYRSLGSIQPCRMVPADSRGIPRVPRYSGYRYGSGRCAYRAFTVYGPAFKPVPLAHPRPTARSYNPARALTRTVWASSPVARRYWGNHSYFLFLRVLRCFSSPRWPPAMRDGIPSGCRVVPFGNPRIKGHLRLPAAFRSLSRPSSPPRA